MDVQLTLTVFNSFNIYSQLQISGEIKQGKKKKSCSLMILVPFAKGIN